MQKLNPRMLSWEITQFSMKRATTTNHKFPDYEVQLKLTSQTFANFTVRISLGGNFSNPKFTNQTGYSLYRGYAILRGCPNSEWVLVIRSTQCIHSASLKVILTQHNIPSCIVLMLPQRLKIERCVIFSTCEDAHCHMILSQQYMCKWHECIYVFITSCWR